MGGYDLKAELRREEILKTATLLFSQKGYYETHLETVIRTAQIGKGTFYRYFKNKEDLFVAVLQRFLNKWEEEVFIDPSTFTPESIFEHFRQLTLRSFMFFRNHDDLCNIYLRIGPGLSDNFEPYMHRFEKRLILYIEKYLEIGMALGYVKPGVNLEMTSNIIAGAFFRVAYYYFVSGKSKEETTIGALAEDFFNVLMNGILRIP